MGILLAGLVVFSLLIIIGVYYWNEMPKTLFEKTLDVYVRLDKERLLVGAKTNVQDLDKGIIEVEFTKHLLSNKKKQIPEEYITYMFVSVLHNNVVIHVDDNLLMKSDYDSTELFIQSVEECLSNSMKIKTESFKEHRKNKTKKRQNRLNKTEYLGN